MLKALSDPSLIDEFKQFIESQDLEDERVAAIIETSPRILFDAFDEHKVYIQITYYDGPKFWCSINGIESENKHDNRKDAEVEAIVGAFIILEGKL